MYLDNCKNNINAVSMTVLYEICNGVVTEPVLVKGLFWLKALSNKKVINNFLFTGINK